MPQGDHDWLDSDAGPVVRPYAVTGGRARPVVGGFDLVAFVVNASGGAGEDSREGYAEAEREQESPATGGTSSARPPTTVTSVLTKSNSENICRERLDTPANGLATATRAEGRSRSNGSTFVAT